MATMNTTENRPAGRDRIDRHAAAALMGVTLRTLHRWAERGLITVERHPIHGRPLYSRRELTALRGSVRVRPERWSGKEQGAD